ncbi:MAG TPA: hypothetical protein VFD52_06935, partial [Clostridia bacterium]|nr:hypothetical protein [Clostridia bacterium]
EDKFYSDCIIQLRCNKCKSNKWSCSYIEKNETCVYNQFLKIANSFKNQNEVDSNYIEQIRYNTYKGKKRIGSYIEENKNCVYNRLLRVANHLTRVKYGTDTLIIKGLLFVVDPFCISKGQKFFVELGKNNYYIKKKRFKISLNSHHVFSYEVEIPYSDIIELEIHTRFGLCFIDKKGFGINKTASYNLFDSGGTNYRSSKVKTFEDINTSIYVRQSAKNGLYITNRVINKTDSKNENRKINIAYYISKLYAKKDIALFYEKMAYKYEESAAVLFERLIEQDYKDIFYIIDKNSSQVELIPKKCIPYVVFKYSFKHYLYFFRTNLFVGTESIAHSFELRMKNSHALKKIHNNKYKYLFLQHGITYMLSLNSTARDIFNKNGSFPKNGKVVVSSLVEARHFIDYGNFKFSDLYISGLTKFDKAIKKANADKIVIMPTWRPWDYNTVRINPVESTYYKFLKNLFEQVPLEYREKLIILPHPLFKKTMSENELTKYIPEQFVYDEILKDTALLITDYSSISYDAFYRGANVIFCWEEKDFCMNCYNNTLMLNDDNAFADISYQYEDLGDLIRNNYMTPQRPENIEKYRKIVEFSDNKNTDRLIRMLKYDGLIKK